MKRWMRTATGRTLTVVRADVFGIKGNAERELVATMQGTMICVRLQNRER